MTSRLMDRSTSPLHPTDMSAHSSETSSPRRHERPQLSPKDVQVPHPPPLDVDEKYDSMPSRPAPTERYSEPSIPIKPIVHQLPVRSQSQSSSTPMARPHTSTGSMPPLMQRAHSSPGVDSNGRFITPGQYYTNQRRPASPLSSGRRRSPLRTAMEESYPVSWSGLAIEPNIPEHAELDLSERLPEGLSQISPIPTYHNTFPRSRRRPTSPLHASASAPSLAGPRTDIRATSPHAGGSSSPQPRYYPSDAFSNGFGYSSASSMPSTPSSFRSRSPSISSLETIEDSPDAEEAARLAAEEDAKHRAEMGDSGSESGDSRRRSSLDGRASSLRSNKERKRWSVCGAERRADFSLEPIEE